MRPKQWEVWYVEAHFEEDTSKSKTRPGIVIVAKSDFAICLKITTQGPRENDYTLEYWKEAGCAPDILATAKSIAGGVPLAAVIARDEVYDAVPGGVIGGTFGGNALACAAGIKVLEVIDEEKLIDRANKIGEVITKRFNEWKEKYECVGDVRGLGAMIGVEFVKSKATKEPDAKLVSDIIQYAAKHGLIMENAGTYGNVIRFLAPLVMTDAQLEAGLQIYEEAIKNCAK